MADRHVIYDEMARRHGVPACGHEMAELLDTQDPLASFREKFLLPPGIDADGKIGLAL